MIRDVIFYVARLVIITAILTGVFSMLNLERPTFFWTITGFVFGVSVVVFSILMVFGQKDPSYFVRLVLGSMVVKLIIFMVFVAYFIYMDQQNANVNIVLFLSWYVCYTSVEVFLLFKKISTRN